MKREDKVKEEERRHLVSQYDGGIAYLDFHLGKLIKRLVEIEVYGNCLIIITSDHGDAFGNRDLLEHGVSVYNDQVHISLIIKYPNTRRNRVVDEPVSVVDLMPTVLDLLGIEIPKEVSGQSLLILKPRKSRFLISESFPPGKFASWHPRFRRIERAIFSGTLKFISSTAGKKELYDLSKDPNETNNLYKSNNVAARELEMSLEQWLNTVVAEASSPTKLDKETRERLKSLGYIR